MRMMIKCAANFQVESKMQGSRSIYVKKYILLKDYQREKPAVWEEERGCLGGDAKTRTETLCKVDIYF